MKRFQVSSTLKRMLVEVILITCGVLLALVLDQWNSNRLMRQRSEEALLKITAEIEDNIRILEFVNPNNQKVVSIINGTLSVEGGAEPQLIPALQMVDTAWQTMLSTGVSEYIEYDVLYELSRLYSLHEIYESLSYQILDTINNSRVLILAMNPETQLDDEILYGDQISLLVHSETQLLEMMRGVHSFLENN